MCRRLGGRRVSRRGCFGWSAGCGGDYLVDPRGRAGAELFEDGGLGGADLGALAEGPGGAGEGADGDAVELAAQFGPGLPAGVLRDAGEQQGKPAQDDVGPDPLLFAVVDGAQVDDLLHVSPAALDF